MPSFADFAAKQRRLASWSFNVVHVIAEIIDTQVGTSETRKSITFLLDLAFNAPTVARSSAPLQLQTFVLPVLKAKKYIYLARKIDPEHPSLLFLWTNMVTPLQTLFVSVPCRNTVGCCDPKYFVG